MIPAIFAQADNSHVAGALGIFGLLCLLVALLYVCAWIYALYSAATRSDLSGGERVLWLVLLIFLPGLGTLFYFLLKGTGR